jgi:hypothetical protein
LKKSNRKVPIVAFLAPEIRKAIDEDMMLHPSLNNPSRCVEHACEVYYSSETHKVKFQIGPVIKIMEDKE